LSRVHDLRWLCQCCARCFPGLRTSLLDPVSSAILSCTSYGAKDNSFRARVNGAFWEKRFGLILPSRFDRRWVSDFAAEWGAKAGWVGLFTFPPIAKTRWMGHPSGMGCKSWLVGLFTSHPSQKRDGWGTRAFVGTWPKTDNSKGWLVGLRAFPPIAKTRWTRAVFQARVNAATSKLRRFFATLRMTSKN